MYWSTERGCRQSGQIPVCRKRLCSVLKEQPVPTDKVRHSVAATFKWPTPSSTGFSLCSWVSRAFVAAAFCLPAVCGRRALFARPERFYGAGAFSSVAPIFRSANPPSYQGISFFNPFFLLLDSF